MSTRTSATRYAVALLDVASKHADAAQIEQQLATFVETFDAHAELRLVLTTPSVPAVRKRAIVTAVAERIGMAPQATKLLGLLADRDRLHIAHELLAVYRERLLDQQRVVRAEIRSAAPLSPEAIRAIGTQLGAVTGMKVAVDAAVDPSLIGGVLAKVGGTVYDGTVKSQLERLRQQLVGAG
ncbi:MAG TPA: ATP synthase F1 subunit delta [Phycisphaerae bacterium]|nr:ATP synthase F1 subunit delta [Phycisphaerae bacterium]